MTENMMRCPIFLKKPEILKKKPNHYVAAALVKLLYGYMNSFRCDYLIFTKIIPENVDGPEKENQDPTFLETPWHRFGHLSCHKLEQ